MELCKKYNQDSFLFKPPSNVDRNAYWITRNGDIDMTFNDVVPNDLEQIYFTKLRKKSGRFSLTEGQEPAIFIPRSPETTADARRRYGEIFIRIGR